jgi:hypothetical protein
MDLLFLLVEELVDAESYAGSARWIETIDQTSCTEHFNKYSNLF